MIVDRTPATLLASPGAAASAAIAQRPFGDSMTHVRLVWIEGEIEHWIRFGRITQERIVDRRTRVVGFRPNAVFALIRWASNAHGTILSRIHIVLTVGKDTAYATLPSVEPGGDILLQINGWPRVERVLQTIDQIEALGVDPCDAAPDYWRHLHNRTTAGLPARPYSLERHRAWLRRKELQP
ncbi:DUF2840 domain-containing protein [Sphingomonas sp. PWP1-2]|uniref:DUF2840 domain-containing protein n=1 Tax=Sphingomonas sp. PWP1-2 TaxID=2804558 RepID=UPI003CED4127